MTASQQIYALLSELVAGRCYPLFVPESQTDPPPYIVYNIVSNQPDNTLDGITGHEWVRVQIDVYTKKYDETIKLSAQAVRQLDSITPSIYGGTTYLYDDGLYRGLIEYEFWQTLPT
ncbi:DUF3168 domain-containing protein [Moraxella lacunata]|uniref:DUF3168 domain-containing protein n=1 Tax=Moraxella lacunata TaxID=477 RepID=A0A1V4GV51_MORLA|nr:DUF3168 domain-containing protein [Moraxella lacunata]OPH36502.1 hypothetical protein B5J94_07160 [Moraxella lacunata]